MANVKLSQITAAGSAPALTDVAVGVALGGPTDLLYTFAQISQTIGLAVTSGKTFSSTNTLTLSGTDGSTLNIGTGGTLGTGAFAAAYTLPTASNSVLGGVKIDGTTISISAGTISVNLTNANTWSGVQTFDSGNFKLAGSGSGTTTLNAAATASGVLTLPAATDTIVGRATTDPLTNKTIASSTDVLGGVTLTLGSDATGDIYYRNASGIFTRLGIGSTNNVLTVAAGLPSWAAPSASGVASVGNYTSDTTLNITGTGSGPYTGTVTLEINLANANTWSAAQTFSAAIDSTLSTDSSSVGTGAIFTSGGIGIAKNLWVGDNINLPATTSSVGKVKFGSGAIGVDTTSNIMGPTVTTGLAGSNNVLLGEASGTGLAGASGGSNNVVIGVLSVDSGAALTANNNVCIGTGVGRALTSGGSNILIGPACGNALTSGTSNVLIGTSIGNGAVITGMFNIGLGDAIFSALTSGGSNVGFGANSFLHLTSGGSNSSIGTSCFSNLVSGTQNIGIGTNAGVNYTGAESFNTLIGARGTAGESSTIQLADGNNNLWLDYAHTTASIWTFGAPIAVPGGTNAVLMSTSSVTTGAGTSAGTLTNAPSIGNPTKWIPFNDNGTVRYFPSW